MTPMQGKIAEIMGDVDLEGIAKELYDTIAGKVCDAADAIAIARCAEKGVEDHESHDAQKIYRAAEVTLIHSILRHVANIADHTTL